VVVESRETDSALEAVGMIKREPLAETTGILLIAPRRDDEDAGRAHAHGCAAWLADGCSDERALAREIELVVGGIIARTSITASRSEPATRTALRQAARILLAEDNAINRRVALSMLSELGFKADVVSSGSEALEALERDEYDLVLMDCQMPGMDGYQATRVIRDPHSRVRNKNVPVVALTAHAMATHRQLSIEAGMNDHLTKPIDRDELAEALERWISLPAPSPLGARGSSGTVQEAPPAREAMTSGRGLDRKALIERLSGNESLANELIGIFFDDMPQQLSRLRSAANDERPDLVAEVAHAIKGSASYVHAARLARLANDLETTQGNGDTENTRRLVEELEREFGSLREAATAP